jgi:hypothetical protein
MLPITIEVFKCSHKQVDVFLHNNANVIWSLKGLEGSPLSILVTFLQIKQFQLHYKRCKHPPFLVRQW